MPEFRNFNKEDRDQLVTIKNRLLKFSKEDKLVYFRQKIDSWGLSEIPSELQDLKFVPSILHQDSNIFGEDNITRRAVITISGNETLEYKIAKLLNNKIESNKMIGEYYNEVADANFTLFKYSDNLLNNRYVNRISFYKTITSSDLLKMVSDKIVIIGTRFKANTGDFKTAPGGISVSKNELIAEIATSLAEGKTIKIFSRATGFCSAVIVSLIMILSVFFSKPSKGIMIFVGAILTVLLLNYTSLGFSGYYFRVSETILLGILTYYLCTPFRVNFRK